jgi:hypothetical protein
MAWEEVEGAFAHLYSTFLTGLPFDAKANRHYGEPPNFVHRAQALQRAACRYFQHNPSQEREGKFDEIMRLATGWSSRRNDVAHGRARYIHWALETDSRETLLTGSNLEWCIVPAHFRGDKFTPDDKPTYVLTSREMNRFAKVFWDIANVTNSFMHEIEFQRTVSYGRPPPPHF